jgi:hypothetical protein
MIQTRRGSGLSRKVGRALNANDNETTTSTFGVLSGTATEAAEYETAVPGVEGDGEGAKVMVSGVKAKVSGLATPRTQDNGLMHPSPAIHKTPTPQHQDDDRRSYARPNANGPC